VLNQKRAHLRSLEERFAITITVSADESVRAPQAFIIDRGEQVHTAEAAKAIAERLEATPAPLEEEDDLEVAAAEGEEIVEAAESETVAASEPGDDVGRRRRRRRRRGGRNGGEGAYGEHHEPPHEPIAPEQVSIAAGEEFVGPAEPAATSEDELVEPQAGEFAAPGEADEHRREGDRRRRRGRRGGRRNRHRNGGPERGHETPENAATAEELTMTTSAEPELNEAVADLDAAPRAVSQAPIAAEAPQPVPPEEPVRRRSTIRERAPIGGADENLPPPQTQQPSTPAPGPAPTISESDEAAESAQPRRTGWWSRRFAGG
jgi:ribonuclease E